LLLALRVNEALRVNGEFRVAAAADYRGIGMKGFIPRLSLIICWFAVCMASDLRSDGRRYPYESL